MTWFPVVIGGLRVVAGASTCVIHLFVIMFHYIILIKGYALFFLCVLKGKDDHMYTSSGVCQNVQVISICACKSVFFILIFLTKRAAKIGNCLYSFTSSTFQVHMRSLEK